MSLLTFPLHAAPSSGRLRFRTKPLFNPRLTSSTLSLLLLLLQLLPRCSNKDSFDPAAHPPVWEILVMETQRIQQAVTSAYLGVM
jgi:hypothetical protein